MAGLLGLFCAASSILADQHVVVVLDDSGSMEDRVTTSQGSVPRIEAAKRALIAVLEQLPPETNVGVLALNTQLDGSNWIVPLGSGDKAAWRQNVMQVEAEGGTPLGASLRTAADALVELRNADMYGSYRLLVVTDGEANDPEVLDFYLPQILSRGLQLDVIGVDMQQAHSLANSAHSYRAATDDASLAQAISEVLAETSADDASSAGDFELIAGLPDGFAEQALAALERNRRQPLVEATAGAVAGTVRYNATPSGSAGSVLETLMGLCVCGFGFLFGGTILVIILVGAQKRRGGRGSRRR